MGHFRKWIGKVTHSVSHTRRGLLRFAVHLVLYNGVDDLVEQNDHRVLLLLEYINTLERTEQVHLIAYYVAKLPPAMRTPKYSDVLLGINDTNQRQQLLHEAGIMGLDVAAIAKQTVERIHKTGNAAGHLELWAEQGAQSLGVPVDHCT